MQLTDEQIEKIALDFVKKPGMHGYIEVGDLIDFASALRAAHNAGAQEPVGTAVNDEELGRFWEMHKPASEFPVGTHVYVHPQPMQQTDAARDGLTVERIRKIAETVRDKYGNQTWGQGYLEDADGSYTIPQLPAVFDDFARNLIAEIERLDGAKGE